MAPPDPADPPRPASVENAWSHREDLLAYARRILGSDPDLAEDVVQEAYLRLHEESMAGRVASEARPWLFRVARNLALDERRRARSRKGVRATLSAASSEPRGPLEMLQLTEAARNTLREIDHLPPAERRVLLLDQAGMPPTAIARLMDTTTNAVHQSLFRARRRLRAVCSAAWGLAPIPLARALLRAGDVPVLSRLPSGSGGGLTGATVVAVVAALAGGGALMTIQPAPPHPAHVRADSGVGPPAAANPTVAAVPASPVARSAPALVAAAPAEHPLPREAPAPTRATPAPDAGRRAPRVAPAPPEHPAPVIARRGPEPRAPATPAPDEEDLGVPDGPEEPEEPSVEDRQLGSHTPEHASPQADGPVEAPAEQEPETHEG